MRTIELTWIHRLTSICHLGPCTRDGKPVATINGKDYAVDDELDGMKITGIDIGVVRLKKTTDDEWIEYLIKFREQGIAAKSDSGR